MNIEEAYYLTKEKTKDCLDAYKLYLAPRLNEKFGVGNWTLEYDITPEHFPFDAIFYLNGTYTFNVEVKVRDNLSLNSYKQTKLGINKHAVAYLYFQKFNIPTIYLCLFSDYLCTLNLHQDPDNITSMIARHDRGADKDLYAMYNVNRFKIVA